MTPAINAAKKAKIAFSIHEYDHDPNAESFGLEAAEKLGVDIDRVYKTLVLAVDGNELAVSVVPVAKRLDLKTLASSLAVKKSSMADQKDAERATGYVVGGISPIGQRKRLRTVIDESALLYDTIFVSAGKRGVDIELSPHDLAKLVNGTFASISTS
jgi:Cys-tRNA(Pro)/Cys-tRNA(Cys) deacylase